MASALWGGWKVGNLLTITDTRGADEFVDYNSYIFDAKIPLTFLTSGNIALNKIHINTIKFHFDAVDESSDEAIMSYPTMTFYFSKQVFNNNVTQILNGMHIFGGKSGDLSFQKRCYLNPGGIKDGNKTIKEYGEQEYVLDKQNKWNILDESVEDYDFDNGVIKCSNNGHQYSWPLGSNETHRDAIYGNTWTFFINSIRITYRGKNEIQLGQLYIDNIPIKYIYKDNDNSIGLYNTSNGQIYEYDKEIPRNVKVSVT